MSLRTIRIRAKGNGLVPLIDADGFTLLGATAAKHRWAGRDFDGTPKIEEVVDHAYFHRHIADGDLELIEADDTALKGGA